MVRTLAILMLMTPAVGMAQEPIVPGQTLLGALGPGDRTLNGRAYDDYRYSAIPGAQARVVVRSRQLAADLNIYFYDDYFDMLPLVGAGSALEDSLEFTVPDVDSPTLIVIRVSTLASDSGPATGDYTIELSERQDVNRLLAGYEPGRSVAAKGLSTLQGSCDAPPALHRAVATCALSPHPCREHLPLGIVPRQPSAGPVVRVRPASVQVERLEQPSALNRIPGHNQALHDLEAPTRLLLRPGGAVRGTRREADRAAGVADRAGELPVLRALDHVLDARAVELEVELRLRGRREILGREHLDPLEHDLILRVARRLPVATARVALATGLLRQRFRQEPAARGVRSVHELRHDVIVGLGLAGGPCPAVRRLRHIRKRES